MSALRYLRRIGSPAGKRFRDSYISGRLSSIEGRRYFPMTDVQKSPVTSSQITIFGLWKRVDSMLQTWYQSQTTSPNPPCDPPATVVATLENTTSYPRCVLKYTTSGIFFSIRSTRSYFPSCTAWSSCGRPKPWPYQILYIPRVSPGGQGGRRYGGGGAM